MPRLAAAPEGLCAGAGLERAVSEARPRVPEQRVWPYIKGAGERGGNAVTGGTIMTGGAGLGWAAPLDDSEFPTLDEGGMYESLLVSIVREMGGPVGSSTCWGCWRGGAARPAGRGAAGHGAERVQAVLPTDPGPETKPGGEWLEDTLWPETKPMPLYGSQGPVTETMEDDLTELANGRRCRSRAGSGSAGSAERCAGRRP